MTDIAIRVENYILSGAEGLSKLYHLGHAQHRHDTTSARLSAGLRDALASVFRRQGSGVRDQGASVTNPQPPAPNP